MKINRNERKESVTDIKRKIAGSEKSSQGQPLRDEVTLANLLEA